MKRLRNHLIGVDQGTVNMFSDFEDGGEMWTGTGPRERRQPVVFAESFRSAPTVMVNLTMWDTDHASNMRAEVTAEEVTPDGFDLVFRTWGDSRVARVRAGWTAFGELRQADDWELY